MIKLEDVGKSYLIDGEPFIALKHIHLTISSGEYLSIIGPSGSGKSTLMHIIGLLDQPTTGRVKVYGDDTLSLNDDALSSLRSTFVGFVFQQFNLINKLTVLENILLPTIYARTDFSYNVQEKAYDLIHRFGLNGKESSYPNKISGGQQQRVAIARALIMNPSLILADEPTGNLDTKTGEAILSLLDELNTRDRVTIVVITHEPDVAKRTKKTIAIRDGQIV